MKNVTIKSNLWILPKTFLMEDSELEKFIEITSAIKSILIVEIEPARVSTAKYLFDELVTFNPLVP